VVSLNIPHEKNKPHGIVTVSIGITTGDSIYEQNITAYLQRAEEAVYISKQEGGNSHTCLSFERGERV
jgi:PleD family two-component response regulator